MVKYRNVNSNYRGDFMLKANVVEVKDLNSSIIRGMFELMNENYDNMSFERFNKDLLQKQWVILLMDDNGNIQGFSTLYLTDFLIANESVKVFFSGDTIIAPRFWGKNNLFEVWGKFVFEKAKEFVESEVYWILISKGYKTYMILPLFFKKFYPRPNQEIETSHKKIIDEYCNQNFKDHYDEANGLLVFDGQKDSLKQGVADIEERHLKNKYIKYFIEKNSGYINGNELVCIAKIDNDNLSRVGQRVLR